MVGEMIRSLYWGPFARLLSRFMPEALVPVILNLWPWLLSVGGLALFIFGEREPGGIGIFAVLTAYFSWQIYAAWSWYGFDQIEAIIARAEAMKDPESAQSDDTVQLRPPLTVGTIAKS
jgi:hypothetical protein